MLRRDSPLYYARMRAAGSRLLAAIIQLSISASCLASEPTLEWIRQFGGTVDGENVEGMSLDGLGHIYVTGATSNSSSAANAVGFLRKFDVLGDQLWARYFGGASGGVGRGVSADALGSVFIAGYYDGVLVRNYDADGNELWSRRPAGISGDDVSADGAGNVYVSGRANGIGQVKKFDASGSELWSSEQFLTGLSSNSVHVAADVLGNIFALGDDFAGPGGNLLVFLTRLDSDGNKDWTRRIASGRYVWAGGLAADGLGNVYISGRSNYTLTDSREYVGEDAFLAKYDCAGNRLWIREFGTSGFSESAYGVAVDGLGNVYVVGNTLGGSLGGPNLGENDVFLAKYDEDGNQFWIHQFGTTAVDDARYVSADGLGNIYIAGVTSGELGGPLFGRFDVFLAKFRDDSIPALPGDFNHDGTVDAADYVVWRKGFGTTYIQNDYDTWRAKFGTSSGGSSASSAISKSAAPEPSSILLLAFLGGLVVHTRHFLRGPMAASASS